MGGNKPIFRENLINLHLLSTNIYVNQKLEMPKIFTYIRKIASAVLLLMIFSLAVSGQQKSHITIGNNLLYDATLTPNLRLGFRLSDHWSAGLTAGFRPWPSDDDVNTKWKHLLLSPDVRYWFKGVNTGHFIGGNLIYSHYNISNVKLLIYNMHLDKDLRRQGDLGAVGAFYGYSWALGRYWNIEAVIGAAVGYTKFKTYECGHCGKKLKDENKVLLMPQGALNIVYNIPGRPLKSVPLDTPVEPVVLPEPEPVTEAFVFIPALSKVHVGTTGQMRQDQRALNVHFPFDRTELLVDFRDNAQVLKQIIDITHHIMVDSMIDVKKIQIVGLASVEGPVAHNEQLGRDRAMALQRYVQQQLQLPDSLFGTVGGGEAWDDFRSQLEELAAAESEHEYAEEMRQALAIIDKEEDLNMRERKLKRMNGGRTWSYIKQHILRDQRNSGYIRVYYQAETDKVAITINHAVELLRTDCSDCHHEALGVLNAVRDDERAQNALGVALWYCGRESEALEHFRRAAANGDADAANNLRQLEKRNQNSNN